MTFEFDLNTIISSGILLTVLGGVKGIFGIKKQVTKINNRVGKIETRQDSQEQICKERNDSLHGRMRTHQEVSHKN